MDEREMARDEWLERQAWLEMLYCDCEVCSCQDEKGEDDTVAEQYPCALCGLKRHPQTLYVVLIRRGPVKICVWCVDSIKLDTKDRWNPWSDNRNVYINEETMRCKHLLERLEGAHEH